ncbi:uncharacterized protein A1O9_11168 [Exophiala aquamarina CBS 119918]|uniref:Uncharacterized protein n=1 Tax=Exophiala aquamarina CBS 119918 TaxID=1182545 RepID=A0A072NYV6_9EURO|nr:uncharacterized protein A1O9_11168 [Exophiala aquamarina CBS 119918]KEF52751.1 hypothetical protein A1O9_11168 [Exophiala aquamarina CBS 119918]
MERVLFGNPMRYIGSTKDIDRQVLITLLEKDLDELGMQIRSSPLSSKSSTRKPLDCTGLIAFLQSPVSVLYLLTTCAFLLLKALKSRYSQYLDFEGGKKSFNASVLALPRWSVTNNDLSGRIAEILLLLWRGLDASSAKTEDEPRLRLHSR